MDNFSKKDIFLVLGGVILGGVIGLLVLLGTDDHYWDRIATLLGREEGGGVGAHAPDFELLSLDGDKVLLSEHLGKTILINFWATWCSPCRDEMPLFERYARMYDQELVILAVNMQETKEEIQIFKEGLGLTFPILLDADGQVSRLYRIQGLPTTYIIDPDGIIAFVHIGTISETQLNGYLEKIGLSND